MTTGIYAYKRVRPTRIVSLHQQMGTEWGGVRGTGMYVQSRRLKVKVSTNGRLPALWLFATFRLVGENWPLNVYPRAFSAVQDLVDFRTNACNQSCYDTYVCKIVLAWCMHTYMH